MPYLAKDCRIGHGMINILLKRIGFVGDEAIVLLESTPKVADYPVSAAHEMLRASGLPA